jgi:hypothetical protein
LKWLFQGIFLCDVFPNVWLRSWKLSPFDYHIIEIDGELMVCGLLTKIQPKNGNMLILLYKGVL